MRKYLLIALIFLYPLILLAPDMDNLYKANYTKDIHKELRIQEKTKAFNEKVIRVAEVIKEIESGGRYKIRGASGEYGAYQYVPATWAIYSYAYCGKVLDITVPENQDKVTQYKIRSMMIKGYSIEDIAATWNSGSKDNWETKIGVNKFGVKYNVPLYVNKFKSMYNKQLTNV